MCKDSSPVSMSSVRNTIMAPNVSEWQQDSTSWGVLCHHSAQRGSSHLFNTSNVEGVGIVTWWRGWAQCRQVKWSFLSNLPYRAQWFTKRTALHTTLQPNQCWEPIGAMIFMCCRDWGKKQQDGELHHERYVGGMREGTEETWEVSTTYFAKTPQNSIHLTKS